MRLALFALMVVCFVDVMGQGIAFPVFDALLLKPESGFLAAGTSQARASELYGIAFGTFFFTWFFGSVYISRLSDSIGRRLGILICLLGAVAGYGLAGNEHLATRNLGPTMVVSPIPTPSSRPPRPSCLSWWAASSTRSPWR